MWNNQSVGLSYLCCCWSISQPWRRAKLLYKKNKRAEFQMFTAATVCVFHSVFFDLGNFRPTVLPFPSPFCSHVNQLAFDRRIYHQLPATCSEDSEVLCTEWTQMLYKVCKDCDDRGYFTLDPQVKWQSFKKGWSQATNTMLRGFNTSSHLPDKLLPVTDTVVT